MFQEHRRFWNKIHVRDCGQVSSLAVASGELKVSLAKNGVLFATTISLHKKQSFRFSLNLQKEASPFLYLYDHTIPSSLASISSQLTVDLLRPELGNILESPGAHHFNLMTQEWRLLKDLEDVIRHWQDRSWPLHLTLFERTMDDRGRVLAQVGIQGHGHGDDYSHNDNTISRSDCFPITTSPSSKFTIFSQWDCEYMTEPLSDYTAFLLDRATPHTPAGCTEGVYLKRLVSTPTISLPRARNLASIKP